MKNTKNALVAFATVLLLAFSSTIMAGNKHKHRHQDHDHHRHHDHGSYAKVIHIKPIYETIRVAVPEKHCRHHEIRRPVKRHVHRHGAGDVLLGGVIGGVIGHELGRNANQELATVAGVLIGSAIAHDAGSKHYYTGEYRVDHRRHCRTETHYRTERKFMGYRVKYVYQGDVYTRHMHDHPGKRFRIDRHDRRRDKHHGERHGKWY